MNLHQLTRRDFLRSSALLGAGVVIVGCAPAATSPTGGEAAEAPSADMQTMSLWHVSENELDGIIAAFEEENSVAVEFQYYPWGDFFDKLQTAYAAGDPPDVHRQDDDEIPFFVQRDVLTPLDDAVAANLNQENLFWDAVESTMINGSLWVSVPAMRVGNLVYNRTLFEEAGVALPPTTFPNDGWDFATFAETARQLSDPDNMIFGMAGADHPDFVISIGRSNGGQVIDENCGEFLMTGGANDQRHAGSGGLNCGRCGR